mmetsp:Transcript_9243/g.25907  ORF Transcript_9243/g.25907 Transcript_9243/m.25907 type:complete len:229 (+) Transcript_9243:107-793(+)
MPSMAPEKATESRPQQGLSSVVPDCGLLGNDDPIVNEILVPADVSAPHRGVGRAGGHRLVLLKPRVLERRARAGPLYVVVRQHPHDQVAGLRTVPEDWVREVDLRDLQPPPDLRHLGGADPVLAGLVVEHLVMEGKLSAQEPVGDDAHGEDVRQRRVLPRVGLLRDVLVRADNVLGRGRVGSPLLQRIKVDHLDGRRGLEVLGRKVQHDILQLQILVHGVVRVQVDQG